MTYQELSTSLTNMDSNILSGKNTNGENIILQRLDKECILLITSQSNGWCRKNYYWKDGTVEETYER